MLPGEVSFPGRGWEGLPDLPNVKTHARRSERPVRTENYGSENGWTPPEGGITC